MSDQTVARVFLVVAPGLESLLVDECRELELPVLETETGGVLLGPGADLFRANLELRLATRVLLRVASFEARHFSELSKRARDVPWERFVMPGDGLELKVTSKKSKLYHQDAIAERLLEAASRRVAVVAADAVPEERRQAFVVRLHRDRVSIAVDSSGELLHRRGYRMEGGKAPLRETLAAALLRASGWDTRAPLVDPFMGSGTVPIEAAMLARRLAPGLGRRFAFERWPDFDRRQWDAMLDRARSAVVPAAGPIFGSDRDAGAVAVARANAERAGVSADLSLEQRALSEVEPRSGPAWLVTNPPYGARIGDVAALRNLYARLGQVRRERFAAGSATLLTADRSLERALGCPTQARFTTRNGGLLVRCVSF